MAPNTSEGHFASTMLGSLAGGAVFMGTQGMPWTQSVILCAVFGGLAAVARFYENSRDQRKRDEEALTIVNNGGRNFLLYLRPFHVTNALSLANPEYVAGSAVTSAGYKPEAVDFETLMQNVASDEWPILALGQPGEAVGVGRVETDDAEWEHVFEDLSLRAHAVIIVPGTREGILRELRSLKSRALLGKCLFVLPGALARHPEWNLDATRLAFAADLPDPPEKPGAIVTFRLTDDGGVADVRQASEALVAHLQKALQPILDAPPIPGELPAMARPVVEPRPMPEAPPTPPSEPLRERFRKAMQNWPERVPEPPLPDVMPGSRIPGVRAAVVAVVAGVAVVAVFYWAWSLGQPRTATADASVSTSPPMPVSNPPVADPVPPPPAVPSPPERPPAPERPAAPAAEEFVMVRSGDRRARLPAPPGMVPLSQYDLETFRLQNAFASTIADTVHAVFRKQAYGFVMFQVRTPDRDNDRKDLLEFIASGDRCSQAGQLPVGAGKGYTICRSFAGGLAGMFIALEANGIPLILDGRSRASESGELLFVAEQWIKEILAANRAVPQTGGHSK